MIKKIILTRATGSFSSGTWRTSLVSTVRKEGADSRLNRLIKITGRVLQKNESYHMLFVADAATMFLFDSKLIGLAVNTLKGDVGPVARFFRSLYSENIRGERETQQRNTYALTGMGAVERSDTA